MTARRLRSVVGALARLPRAVRGALAFLSRLPVGGGQPAWEAFRRTPASFPLAGYLLGAVAAVPFLLGLPPESTTVLYLLVIYALTGVTHADGLADLADAASVHRGGDGESASEEATGEGISSEDPAGNGLAQRRAVMKDSATGVGGALAVGLSVVALALAALALARAATGPTLSIGSLEGSALHAVATIVAAEVGAKAGMGVLACLGRPAHEGLGSQLLVPNRPVAVVGVGLAALPATLLAGLDGVVVLLAVLAAGPAVALAVGHWAIGRLGGVSGDVFGAVNELGRLVGLHVGIVGWFLVG